jgi:hypothetical protein
MVGYANGTPEKASYLFIIDDWKNKVQVSLRDVSADNVAKVFHKGKVKDNASEPRSYKGITYRQMVEDILGGIDRISWVWSNHLQDFYVAAKELGAIISGGR